MFNMALHPHQQWCGTTAQKGKEEAMSKKTLMLGFALAMVMAVAMIEKKQADVITEARSTNTAEVTAVRDHSLTVKDMRVGVYPERPDDTLEDTRFNTHKLEVEWQPPVVADNTDVGEQTFFQCSRSHICFSGAACFKVPTSLAYVWGERKERLNQRETVALRDLSKTSGEPSYFGHLLRIHRHGSGRFSGAAIG